MVFSVTGDGEVWLVVVLVLLGFAALCGVVSLVVSFVALLMDLHDRPSGGADDDEEEYDM